MEIDLFLMQIGVFLVLARQICWLFILLVPPVTKTVLGNHVKSGASLFLSVCIPLGTNMTHRQQCTNTIRCHDKCCQLQLSCLNAITLANTVDSNWLLASAAVISDTSELETSDI